MEWHPCTECKHFCCIDKMILNQEKHPCKEFKKDMSIEQYKALYDFLEENRCTKHDVLNALKESGAIDRNASIRDLGEYVNGNTYEAMRKFLEDNLLW